MTAFLMVSLAGSTSTNGTLLNTLGFQSGKTNLSRVHRIEEHVLGGDDRRHLVERLSGRISPFGEELEQVAQFLGLHHLLEAFGLSDLSVSLIEATSSRLSACRLASPSTTSIAVLLSEVRKPDDDPIVGGDDSIRLVVPLHAPRGIEDVDKQFLLGMDCHAGEVGPIWGAFARVLVTLRAVLREHLFAVGYVACLCNRGLQLINHFCRSGLGNPPPGRGVSWPAQPRPVRDGLARAVR